MKILGSIYPHIVFHLCVFIFIKTFFDFPNENTQNYWWKAFIRVLDFKYPPKTENVSVLSFRTLQKSTDLTSSVFCRGSNHTDRLCSFTNLCYEPTNRTFVFFSGSSSVRSGLPHDRFSPALVDFSSVEDHNTLYFNYVEIPLSSADQFNFSFIDGHALVFKRFNPENLMHVFHDDLIPAFATLQEIPFSNMFLVFADEWQPGPYAFLYKNFLPKQPMYIRSLSQNHLHCFKNIHVGLNKLPTWYHYGFKVPQGPLPKPIKDIAPIILAFRDYFLQRFVSLTIPVEEHAVLFTRRHNRRILNEREVIKRMSQITNLPTHIISLDSDDIPQIVASLRSCRMAVGIHGSILVLSLFLDPGSILIEMFPFGIQSSDVTPYKTLSQILGLTYKAWENNVEGNTHPHPEYPAALGGLEHLSLEEQDQVSHSMVMPFLCCENPVWLYRIYQDTTVDLGSFTDILHSGLNSHPGSPMTQLIHSTRIQPSEVINVSCAIQFGEMTSQATSLTNTEPPAGLKHEGKPIVASLTLSWSEPWNLHFVDPPFVVEYEVWLQEIATEEVKAFLVKQRQLVISVQSVRNASYYAWVRCYVDGRVGPFSSNPTICSEL